MRVAVYCGANTGSSPHFAEAARALGEGLARNGHDIIYGGASRGLMGELADAALAAGGHVTGVLPRSLGHREIAHAGISELHLVDTMHERKARIMDLADAIAVLPGGIGTLDEFFEAFTWAQIGIHSKPIALIDVDGFYQPLLAHLQGMVAAGFLTAERVGTLMVCPDAASFITTISTGAVPPAASPRYASLSVE
ncbi:MAG: TIGR00730 family Rossman fold protein [Gemmatimonadota bacterium]|nr:TIGR00730 family Rossman fold protein [Gemmatimonadota bacterium]